MNNQEQYGKELAKKVAKFIEKKSTLNSICYFHRDYCGVGFFLKEGIYYYTHFFDGYPSLVFDSEKPENLIQKFTKKSEFVNWLAKQSDQSLSGENDYNYHGYDNSFYVDNQRITKKRLKNILAEK